MASTAGKTAEKGDASLVQLNAIVNKEGGSHSKDRNEFVLSFLNT